MATFPRRSPGRKREEIGMKEDELRKQMVHFAKLMISTGLVRGTSGNLSTREPGAETCLITPSGVDYDTMRPEDVVLVDLTGLLLSSGFKPSVDTPIHVAIYRSRPDVGACIHTHSPYAAAFSSVGREIPP